MKVQVGSQRCGTTAILSIELWTELCMSNVLRLPRVKFSINFSSEDLLFLPLIISNIDEETRTSRDGRRRTGVELKGHGDIPCVGVEDVRHALQTGPVNGTRR